jgi:hypothetical protein
MDFLIVLFVVCYAIQLLYAIIHITLDSDQPPMERSFSNVWDMLKVFIPFQFVRILFTFKH